MKILITYHASTEAEAGLLRSLEVQKQWPLAENITQAIICERGIMGLDIPMIVDPTLVGVGGYAHARARNHAIAAARKADVDYLVSLDSDAVFRGFPAGVVPSDLERIRMFYQKEGETITSEALADPARVSYSSFWVISRALFSQDWCEAYEGFVGYGWEDFDFVFNVMAPRGYRMVNSEASMIHLWHHPQRNRNEHEFAAEYLRNKRLYEARRSSPLRNVNTEAPVY